MRIAVFGLDCLPGASTASEQLVNNAAALARSGIEVDLMVQPHDADTRPPRERAAAIAEFYGLPSDAFDSGLNLVEIPVPSWLRGNAKRAAFSFLVRRACRRSDYDLVYVRDLFTLAVAVTSGKPVVFDTYRVDINTSRRHRIWRSYCYRGGALIGVVAHSQMARRPFLDIGFAPERVLAAHNGFSPGIMEPALTTREAREKLGLPIGKKIAVYTGHVNRAKGVETLIAAAKWSTDILYLLVGAIPGSDSERWAQRLIAESRADNVRCIARVAPSKVPTYMYAADCLIIPPAASPLEKYGRTVLPIKTFLYLAAGKPVVAADLPDTREVLTDGRNACLVPPDDPRATADAVNALLSDPARIQRLSAAAREDSRSYTWDSRAARISRFLHERLASLSDGSAGHRRH